jgi:hypothetical protein
MTLNGMNYGQYFADLEDNGDCGPKAYKIDCGDDDSYKQLITVNATG